MPSLMVWVWYPGPPYMVEEGNQIPQVTLNLHIHIVACAHACMHTIDKYNFQMLKTVPVVPDVYETNKQYVADEALSAWHMFYLHKITKIDSTSTVRLTGKRDLKLRWIAEVSQVRSNWAWTQPNQWDLHPAPSLQLPHRLVSPLSSCYCTELVLNTVWLGHAPLPAALREQCGIPTDNHRQLAWSAAFTFKSPTSVLARMASLLTTYQSESCHSPQLHKPVS